MCTRTPVMLSTKTEREGLEEALARTDALHRDWCEDGQRIIRAARKHLETLPKPSRKVLKTRYLVVAPNVERGPFLDHDDATSVAKSYTGGRIVNLEGFDYEPWEEANNTRPAR